MLSKVCRPRRLSQLHRRYQHIGVGNSHEEKSEQYWNVKLNNVSIVSQDPARCGLEAYRSCSKRSHDSVPEHIPSGRASAVCLVSVDRRNALY
jgi:hypothetical protein